MEVIACCWAYGGLGMLLIETGKPEQALGLIKQGLQLEPEARWMQEIQVIALALNNHYPKAEEVLESLRFAGDTPQITGRSGGSQRHGDCAPEPGEVVGAVGGV